MGVGSGEEDRDGFVRELSAIVADPVELGRLEAFCERYDPPILIEALARLRRTPRERIRKTPAALFTYLVKIIHRERSA